MPFPLKYSKKEKAEMSKKKGKKKDRAAQLDFFKKK